MSFQWGNMWIVVACRRLNCIAVLTLSRTCYLLCLILSRDPLPLCDSQEMKRSKCVVSRHRLDDLIDIASRRLLVTHRMVFFPIVHADHQVDVVNGSWRSHDFVHLNNLHLRHHCDRRFSRQENCVAADMASTIW